MNEENENPPSAETVMELYKEVFGCGQKDRLERFTAEETKHIVWFCTSVVGIISVKETGKARRHKSYSQRVTPSDEAFALMALKHHQGKWNPSEEDATDEQPKKKRCVASRFHCVSVSLRLGLRGVASCPNMLLVMGLHA